LEKHPAGDGAINVVVRSLRPVEAAPRVGAAERRGPAPVREVTVPAGGSRDASEGMETALAGAAPGGGAEGVRDFGTVAPAVQSFGSGRRR
jgi:hypothetical protein